MKYCATPILPFKISLYIPILEVLFSSDSTEVSHKVSERVSKYLGGEKSLQIDRYKKLKEVYNVRSRYLHGSQLDSKPLKKFPLEEMAVFIDGVVREFSMVIS